jgi:hypothetical protein
METVCKRCNGRNGVHLHDCPSGMTFSEWFATLRRLAVLHRFPVSTEDRDSYREYFDDGDSPADALDAEMARGIGPEEECDA